jgi:hypothetical protein
MYKEQFEEIESCELIGDFNDEYVYDIEVNDDTHTFVANDMLVHNSLFVSFNPIINHCDWKNTYFNRKYMESVDVNFVILTDKKIKVNNTKFVSVFSDVDSLVKFEGSYDLIIIDGVFVKDYGLNDFLKSDKFKSGIKYNWCTEVDFIQGVDYLKYGQYFKDCLTEYADSYGVENKEDFELERISESMINIAKKKYICHIIHEDGFDYDRLNYIYPKGVELIRSSTPLFAREKIVNIVKYLFSNPDTFSAKELLGLIKQLRKEFELADIDTICMQSSCSNYEIKVIDDRKLPLQFVSGAHFAVKASGHYNYLLSENKKYQSKYEFIKSGTKVKYYYCKNNSVNPIFAYMRGSYPMEFAPEIDYDEQFMKAILSPINSIIAPLGLPEITKRLSVVIDIFSGI